LSFDFHADSCGTDNILLQLVDDDCNDLSV